MLEHEVQGYTHSAVKNCHKIVVDSGDLTDVVFADDVAVEVESKQGPAVYTADQVGSILDLAADMLEREEYYTLYSVVAIEL